MSTMRPEASEITGTVREMSGNTVPVTDNCDGAWYSVAFTIGYHSGCLTAKKVDVHSGNHLGRGWCFCRCIGLLLAAPRQDRKQDCD